MLLSVSGLSINSKYSRYLVTKCLKMSLFLVHVTGLLAVLQTIHRFHNRFHNHGEGPY